MKLKSVLFSGSICLTDEFCFTGMNFNESEQKISIQLQMKSEKMGIL